MHPFMTDEQAQFIDLLMSGKTEDEAMAEMELDPETIAAWDTESSLFGLILLYHRSPELQPENQVALWAKIQRLMSERMELHRKTDKPEPGSNQLELILRLTANSRELEQAFKELDDNPLKGPQ